MKPLTDELLDQMRHRADPLADETVARLLGPWPVLPEDASPADWQAALAPQWQRLRLISEAWSAWKSNADLLAWQGAELPEDLAAPLRDYLQAGQALPAWADAAKIQRAEQLFFEEGVLSCLLLFCASLPECYVVPDLAEVLHATAQLEARTEHRIRATASMIFPVMLRGGLTAPEGSGRAQVLKVRLIHATVRHLLLRGTPAAAEALGAAVPQIAAAAQASMNATLFAHGWSPQQEGLPCNQEELAYTLLTFGYVPLRGLRQFGVAHRPADEEALLHTWNVMGSLVGVREELMAHSMDDAAQLFARLQARGRAEIVTPDPRAGLGQALMDSMARIIPWPVFKSMPVLLTRYLCGRRSAADIGLSRQARPVPLRSELVFWLLLLVARGIDFLGQLLVRGFSISRLLGRLLGYQLLTRLLLDQTRPLRLPDPVMNQLQQTVAGWGQDRQAPAWMNKLEDRYTMAGDWRAPLA